MSASSASSAKKTMNQTQHWQCGKSLNQCFSHILWNELMSDVTFNFKQDGGVPLTISAHKLVLSTRSPVFEAMFRGDFLESSKSVDITDAGIASFKAMLRYIYSDEVKLADTNVLEVVYLGRKYMLDGLVQACVSFLRQGMTPQNVCSVLSQAIHFKEDSIVEMSLNFMQKNIEQVLNTREFCELSHQALEMFLKRERHIAEHCVLVAVLKWAQNHRETEQTQSPREVLDSCIYLIKYANLTIDQFATYLGETPILTEREKCLFFCYFVRRDEETRKKLVELGFDIPQNQLGNVIVAPQPFMRGRNTQIITLWGEPQGNYPTFR